MDKIDPKTVLMLIASSLTGYVFYGHISLQAKVETMQAKQDQVLSEQRDIWTKYNNDIENKFKMLEKFMEFQLKEQEDKAMLKEEIDALRIEMLEREIIQDKNR